MNTQMFSARVRACTGRLWRITWSILRNGADCDDAVQNALLRAWKGLPGLKHEEFFETWLTRILINECKALLQRRAKMPGALPETLPVQEAPAANQELSDAIAALPLNLRIPLVLHYMEGYSAGEIARMLKLPETTVKWRLHSARRKIKEDWTK